MRKFIPLPVAIAIVVAVVCLIALASRQPANVVDLNSPVVTGTAAPRSADTGQSQSPNAPSDSSDTTETNIRLPPGCITAGITQASIDQSEHPLDTLLQIADLALQQIDEKVQDYSATLTSQVRIANELQPEKFLHLKIRHEQLSSAGVKVPFSVYTKFLAPPDKAGQEAIWVQGWHQGNLVAHTTGVMNLKRFYLDPDGSLAMDGNLHPIRDIGVRNLIVKMQEVGSHDRQHDECSVTLTRNLKINERPCTMLEITHPLPRPHFEFHFACIYLDDELNIPIAYEGYLWPDQPGEPAPLLEKYFYTDIQLNTGLKDIDFDPANEAYDYPSW